MIYLSKNDIFLFQGDSITHGGRVESKTDMNHIMGHGFQSVIAGRLAFENMSRMPTIINRGVSGDTTQKLVDRWQVDTISLQPTVLNLLIGINDSYQITENAAEVYENNLRFLLKQTTEQLPGIKIILCEPFAFECPSYEDEKHKHTVLFNMNKCRECAAAAKKLAEDYNALFVPFFDELKTYVEKCPPGSIIWDGIHPTFLGHEIMARFWYNTVDKSGILTE